MTTLLRRALRTVSLLAAGFFLPCMQAQSTVYKCVDERGRVEFTDSNKRGCKPLDLPGFIASPPLRQPPARQAGAAPGAPRAAAPALPSPAGFPRVDASEQRARDDDRRGILNEELRGEEKKLAELKRAGNGGPEQRDDLARTERNIAALKREIANIR
jgi:hypothetical protein